MAIIAISGYPGAGKSTLAEKLAEALNYENINIGEIFRKLAAEAGISPEEFYKAIAKNPGLEKEIDDEQKEIIKTKNNIVIQGRMAPFLKTHFQKINILLKVEEKEGARRQMSRPQNKGKTFKEVLKLSKERLKTEKKRYFNLHKIANHLDETKFDIVINTTELTKDQVFAIAFMDIATAIKL